MLPPGKPDSGTGAQWVRSITRVVYALKRAHRSAPWVKFIDPDRVEAHNVGRQLFTPANVGLSKAEVLARRFNYALGLDIAWFPEPLDCGDRKVYPRRFSRSGCLATAGMTTWFI